MSNTCFSLNVLDSSITAKIVVVKVLNNLGVLNRVSSLLRRRGFNINSLTVATSQDPKISRMTIVFDKNTVSEQVVLQLSKLIEVVEVFEMDPHNTVLSESLFIDVSAPLTKREEIIEVVSIFHPTATYIINEKDQSIVFKLFDTPEQIENMIILLRKFGIIDLVRSGIMAIRMPFQL